MILIIVALLLVAAVGGAITEDGNQDAFDTAMEELPFAGPISKVLCNFMKLDKGEELLSANDLITDVLKILIMSCIHPAIARILSRIFLKLPAGSVYDQEAYMETMSYRIKELVVLVLTAIPVAYLTGVGVGAAKNALEESICVVLDFTFCCNNRCFFHFCLPVFERWSVVRQGVAYKNIQHGYRKFT